MQNSAIRNSCSRYLSNDISTILLTGEKIFTVVTPKSPKNHQLYATAATEKKRPHGKTSTHTINVQTVTDGISRRVISIRENTSLILVDHGVKVIVT